MKEEFKQSAPFLLLSGLYWLACVAVLLYYPKGGFEILINKHNTPYADCLFKYATWMGDGVFHIILLVGMAFINRKYFWPGLISFIFIAILSPLFKYVLFPGTLRPVEYLKDIPLHLVAGVKMAHVNSFPSGHTMTAFAWGLWLAVFFKNKYAQAAMFLLALSVALSRVYLMQHFIGDTLAGSIMGVMCMYASFYIYNRLRNKRGKSI